MTSTDKTPKTRKILRIGCLSILALFGVAIVVIATYFYSFYHSITSGIEERHQEKISDLNQLRKKGLVDFDIAFKGCELYTAPTGTSDWQRAPLDYGHGQYPQALTGCTSAVHWVEGEWLWVKTCAQAIGAGGGCGRYGTFKTRNGKEWLRIEPSQ